MSNTTERALIGTDAKGEPIILATDGTTIAFDVTEISCQCCDIGMYTEIESPGLYLWTGTAKWIDGEETWQGKPEPYVEYVGTLRKVEPHEIAELYAMQAPEPAYPEDDRETPTL